MLVLVDIENIFLQIWVQKSALCLNCMSCYHLSEGMDIQESEMDMSL